jgi:tetratricopeptide (TPR) repeat protein
VSPARPARLDPDRRAALEEERDFLLRSLQDLEREHDAGDLDDDDYAELKDDYTARAAEVLRALDAEEAAFAAAKRPRRLGRTLATVAGVLVFAVVAGVLAAQAMGARKAGESATGGIGVEQSLSQRANECSTKIQTEPDAAFECFEEILAEDDENVVANTWSAWLLSLSAPSFEEPERTTAQGLAAVRLEKAVEAQPTYSYARAFRAVVAYRNGRYAEAKQYLEEFEANNPSADARQIIEQFDLEASIDAALAGDPARPGTGAGSAGTTSTTVPDAEG